MKNHLGETEYQTYAGWRRAVKKHYASLSISRSAALRWDGDKDICEAIYINPISGLVHGIAHWGGDVGSIYK